MPPIDVPLFTDPAASATYLAAVKQADAAIRAAEIAADATWATSLYISAPIAIVTAAAALSAGGLAYWGSMATAKAAIKAAEHQVQLEKEKHTARVSAYAIRQRQLILRLIHYSIKYDGFCDYILDTIINPGNTAPDFLFLLTETDEFIPKVLPEDWNDEKWEEHALLGNRFVVTLISVRYAYETFEHSIDRFNVLKNRILKEDFFEKNIALDIVTQHKNYIVNYSKDLHALLESFHEVMEKNGLFTP